MSYYSGECFKLFLTWKYTYNPSIKLYHQNKQTNKEKQCGDLAVGVSQVVEYLPGKHEALSSKAEYHKKKKRERENQVLK
jgi:hypothetical protein